MDALLHIELAQNAIGAAIRHGDDDEAMLWFAQAQAYAAIAQAEAAARQAAAMERIADALELLVSGDVYSIDMTMTRR